MCWSFDQSAVEWRRLTQPAPRRPTLPPSQTNWIRLPPFSKLRSRLIFYACIILLGTSGLYSYKNKYVHQARLSCYFSHFAWPNSHKDKIQLKILIKMHYCYIAPLDLQRYNAKKFIFKKTASPRPALFKPKYAYDLLKVNRHVRFKPFYDLVEIIKVLGLFSSKGAICTDL